MDTMRRSFWPSIIESQRQIRYDEWDYDALVYSLLPFPRSLSKQDMSRIATAQTILLAIAMTLRFSGNRYREKKFHTIPLESLLQFKKLSKGRIIYQRRKILRALVLVLVLIFSHRDHRPPSLRRRKARPLRETDLRQESFELPKTFLDLDTVGGGEIIE